MHSGSYPTPTPGRATAVQSSPQKEWEELKIAAQKEGVVTMYTTAGSEVRISLTEAVKEKLGLQLEFVSGRGAELSQKLFTERRAGLFLADVYIAGCTTQINELKPKGILDPLKPLLFLPEVTDMSKWYLGKYWFADKEQAYIFAMTLYPQLMITDQYRHG